MCRKVPARRKAAGTLLVAGLLSAAGFAQQNTRSLAVEWRRIGNSSMDLSLASPATGAVDRVWYAAGGQGLLARTAAGRTFHTADFERWREASEDPPASAPAAAVRLPEPSVLVRRAEARPGRLYAAGRFVFASDDGGRTWTNLTGFKGSSIIGEGVRDLAVSPVSEDEIAVANEAGVWRSVDGGRSWSGLNVELPNLTARRLAGLPRGSRGTRILAVVAGGRREVFEWAPGEKQAWRPVRDAGVEAEDALRQALSEVLGTALTAAARNGSFLYAGAADGRIWVSADQGRSWILRDGAGAPVEDFFVDAREPRRALAAFAAREETTAGRVLRTINGGLVWDDLTSNLPAGAVHGITADVGSGAVYAATAAGLFFTAAELAAAAPATEWTRVGGLPEAPVFDVELDGGGNQIFAAVEGAGVFAAAAPHRFLDPRVLNAADYSARAAAPGSLISVLGARVRSARAGDLSFPVLAASDSESQIQVPFEARGPALALALEMAAGRSVLGVPLETVSPAVFVDRDGTPMVLDADSGVLLDAMTPARSHSRIQVLLTGLGRTRPDWPTGLAAPLESPPRVAAEVKAYLDRAPVEVTSAALAPGYIGFYLVELQLPELVNAGPAELYIEAGGRQSNRVRIYLEP